MLWPLTTGNKKRNSALTMQCSDTLIGFLHKTLRCDNGWEGSRGHILFFLTPTEGGSREQGIGHRGTAAPLPPAGAAHVTYFTYDRGSYHKTQNSLFHAIGVVKISLSHNFREYSPNLKFPLRIFQSVDTRAQNLSYSSGHIIAPNNLSSPPSNSIGFE